MGSWHRLSDLLVAGYAGQPRSSDLPGRPGPHIEDSAPEGYPMNPYVTERLTRYNAARQQIEDLQTRAAGEHRDLTDQELTQVRTIGEQAKALHDEIAPYLEEHHRAAKVGQMAATIAHATGSGAGENLGTGRPDPYGSEADDQVPSLMPSREQVAEMRAAVGESRPLKFTTAARAQEHTRATVTLAGDVGTPQTALGERQPVEPRRIAAAARLIAQRVEGTSGVVFPQFLAGTAGVTAEGVAKQMYDNINPGSATPQVINAWTDFTRQVTTSHLAFESRLRQKLAALVAAREDLLLLTKVLGTTGIVAQAPTADPMAQQLLVAAAKVAAEGQEPDLFAFNPADAGKIFGAGLANTPPGELAELDLRLHGMRGYPTNQVTAGTAVVGAWRAGSRYVVGMAPTFMVDPFTQMKSNVVTGLLEEAVDLAVEEPNLFVNVDLVV